MFLVELGCYHVFEVEDLDEGEFSSILSKLNLDLLCCFKRRVDVTSINVLSVFLSVWKYWLNLLPHLHKANIFELSFIILDLLFLIRCRISI